MDNPALQKDYRTANQDSQDKYRSPVNTHLPFHYLISLSNTEREVIFGVKEIEPESWSYKGARVQGSIPVGSQSFWHFTSFWGQFKAYQAA